jgi:hypothetical protein
MKCVKTAYGTLLTFLVLAWLLIIPNVYAQYAYQPASLYPWSLTILDLESCPELQPCIPLLSPAYVVGNTARIRYSVNYTNLPLGLPRLRMGITSGNSTTYVSGWGQSEPNGCGLNRGQYAARAFCYVLPNNSNGSGLETVFFYLTFDSSGTYSLSATVAVGSSTGNIVANSFIAQPFTLIVTT